MVPRVHVDSAYYSRYAGTKSTPFSFSQKYHYLLAEFRECPTVRNKFPLTSSSRMPRRLATGIARRMFLLCQYFFRLSIKDLHDRTLKK